MPISKHLPTFFKQHKVGFTLIPNKSLILIQNPASVAIWVHLLAKMPKWKPRFLEVKKQFPGLGKQKYYDALKHLRDVRLVWRENHRNENGTLTGSTIHVSDIPNNDISELADNDLNLIQLEEEEKLSTEKTTEMPASRHVGQPRCRLSGNYNNTIKYNNTTTSNHSGEKKIKEGRIDELIGRSPVGTHGEPPVMLYSHYHFHLQKMIENKTELDINSWVNEYHLKKAEMIKKYPDRYPQEMMGKPITNRSYLIDQPTHKDDCNEQEAA